VDVEIEINESDRCPVCAMRVILYPTFAASMELHSGEKFKFCSNGCMIRSWLHPEVFLGAPKTEIKNVWVQDYFSGRRIDGTEAYWVWGSDVRGPMGWEPVPLMSKKDLEPFKRRHGAKTVFHLKELSDEKWEKITGRKIEEE
jgi:nitrous oxide reductase accessory protein NosL